MLNEVLQVLRMLKRAEKPSHEVSEAIEFLEHSVKGRTRQNLLDLMAVGDVVGYDKLQSDLSELTDFINKMKDQHKS